MHRVREIDRRRAARQIDHAALRREHVDRLGEQARLELLQPFAGIGDRVLPVEDLPQPRDLFLVPGIAPAGAAAFLVAPVRGDAVFGMAVHFVRADLHFERLVLGPADGGVERAIVVRLGLGDVVVEFLRERRPQIVHDAERGVAILDLVDEDAHAHECRRPNRCRLCLRRILFQML